MTYLFDTNVVSGQRRVDRLPPQVAAWLAGIRASDVFISIITLHEIEIGILRVERSDLSQGKVLRRWKDEIVLRTFRDRVFCVDEAVAECAARLHIPDPRPAMDALVAATAIVHRMTLVTRNVADFDGMPVTIFNPWALPAA